MGFTGGFRSIFTPTYDAGLASKWWLAGGVASANCVAAYQAKGAASYAASKVNLANPGTYNAVDGTAYPTLGADGWVFGGSQYLTSGIVPGSGWSMIVRFSGASGSAAHSAVGILSASPTARFYIRPRNNNTAHVYGYGDAPNVVTGALIEGVMALAGASSYLDGVYDGLCGSWLVPSNGIVIGADGQAMTYPYIGSIAAISIYNTTLTATRVAAITAAMQAL